LPAEIASRIGTVSEMEKPFQGCAFETYILTAEHGRFVLKLGHGAERIAELESEFRVLEKLQATALHVPQPVIASVQENRGYFVFTCIEGENQVNVLERADRAGKHHLMEEFGRNLRRIHECRPDLPYPDAWMGDVVERIAENIAAGRISLPLRGDGPLQGLAPAVLLAELRRWVAQIEPEMVFGHGDYCVPNAIVRDNRIAGIIDWSAGGYMDRRFDLGTAMWSIGYNLHSREYVESFLKAYGYTGSIESLRYFEAIYHLL
jgi:aminoglycoside phosphotransferase